MYYVPHTNDDKQRMFQSLKIDHIDELFQDIDKGLLNPYINMEKGIDMIQLEEHMKSLSQKNAGHEYQSFLGAGVYDHFIPPILNTLTSRGEFLTSYTPYQPEMSQGLLQAIFEYQTMICELSEMEVSNASLYDGSTALWEAILMAIRINRREKVVLFDPLNPLYADVLKTHMNATGISFNHIPSEKLTFENSNWEEYIDDKTSSVIVQYPNFLGTIEDLSSLADFCRKNKTLLIVSANPLALSLLKTPVSMGADITVGEGQPLGLPLSFGGPYFGFIATHRKYMRQLPGRICGESIDAKGNTSYVLTLQAREQHIRREKATSNICTNQALLALRASIYMTYMGFEGIKRVAQGSHQRLIYLQEAISHIPDISFDKNTSSYCEMVIDLPDTAATYCELALEENILLGYDLSHYNPDWKNRILVAVTEKKTEKNLRKFAKVLEKITQKVKGKN
ncbi:glycine dehydrogenase (aminomethyl-transferring) [PVC group bacterium (ex Bugula neritina AB1)]|nr:glycine dehydrogenase (aminomethyl-transferring) [PVC group bacterium (ex Bugula neritina AB1)]